MGNSPYGAARVARQAKWFTLAKIGVAVVALIWQFVLVRGLSVIDYASFTIFIAANGVLVFVTMLGMDRVVYRFMPPLREAVKWREMDLLMLGLTLARMLLIAVLLLLFWLGAQLLLPEQIRTEVDKLPWHYVAFAFATGCTDSFSIFSNSLGLQGRQAMLLMASTVLRFLLVLLLLWRGALSFVDVADMVVLTECLLALALLFYLVKEMRSLRAPRDGAPPLAFGFRLGTLVTDSLSTQMTYMLGLPFRGSLLKLIVGAVSPPMVTASFGFFQALADRAYQFMPVFLMKGMLEPALASDYAARGDFERIRLALSLLLRVNYLILMLALALLFGCGEPLINLVTKGRYGSEVVLAALILLQLGAMTLGEALWIGLNPIGRISYHNRLWFWFALLCYGGVWFAAHLRSPNGLLVVSIVPYLLVFGWLRWINQEPFLQGGLGLHQLWRLIPPALAAWAVARGVLLLPYGAWLSVAAAIAGGAAYLAVLRSMRLFVSAEVQQIAAISPKLARMLQWTTSSANH